MPVGKFVPSAIAIAWLTMTPAFAADMPALPWLSPSPETAAPSGTFADPYGPLGMHSGGWSGVYLGGQFSYSDMHGDFSQSTQQPVAYSLRETTLQNEFAPSNWPVLGTADHSAPGFGGFIGYNTEYFTPTVNVVFGVEANYDQANLSLFAPNTPISRLTPADSAGNTYLVNITGSGTVSNLDFGTLRARAGWDLGNFLPYAFAGLAVGRANVNITETTSGFENPPPSGACSTSGTPSCTPFSFSSTAGKNGEWLYGFTVGAGLDVALTRHVFLRGEYEYVEFQPIAGVRLDINTARVGGGIRF